MLRKRDIDISILDENSKRAKIEIEKWKVDSITAKRFQQDDSAGDIYLGRRSFGGFNPIVERNYATSVGLLLQQPSKSLTKETSEDDMASHYASLVGLPRGPDQVLKDIRMKCWH